MEEEETFLVIIGDSDVETQITPTVTVKLEHEGVPELKTLMDIVQTTKNEDFITVKLEPKQEECESFLEYEFLEDEEIQIENPRLPKGPDYDPTEEEYIPEGYIPWPSMSLPKPRNPKKMLPPEEQHSFVQDLRNTYPELAQDKELLIQFLCEIMRNVKPPPTPDGSYDKHNDAEYECCHCGYVSETQPAADRHYNEKHGPRYLVCYACGVDFRSTTNLYKHEKRCNARDALVVVRARARRLGSKGRGRPRGDARLGRRDKAKVRYSCTQCSASFVTAATLVAHTNLHNGVKPYRCYACPAAYTSRPVLTRHEQTHKQPRFICDLCARAFTVRAGLIAHLDTHRPIRKYGCEQCERRFAQKAALKLHVNRVHKKLPLPFGCDVCSQRYARMSLLKVHMQQEHGLLIMTRKMFFRKFPNMTDDEMKKAVKVLMSHDELNDQSVYIRQLTNEEAEVKVENEGIKKDDDIETHPEISMEEFMKCFKLEAGATDRLLVVDNAEVLNTKGTREQIQRMLVDDVKAMAENDSDESGEYII